jgi:hypothetical protein
MRIIDLFALQVFTKILERSNFRLLQQNRHLADMQVAAWIVCFLSKSGLAFRSSRNERLWNGPLWCLVLFAD